MPFPEEKRNINGFDKNPQNINRSGANRKSVTHYLKELGSAKEISYEIKFIDKDGNKRTTKGKSQSKDEINKLVAMLLVQKALEGDLKAIQELLDRTEGKPTQKIETPDLSGLRVPRPGWWLGKARKGRFEPSHALAIALPAEKAGIRLDLPLQDARLQTYLRGELVAVDLPDGWVLVTVDGFPLGWGKSVQGVLKNHYPAGLRVV